MSNISTLLPTKFDENVFLTLAKTNDNIIPQQGYHKFYLEVQLYEENLLTYMCKSIYLVYTRKYNGEYPWLCRLADTLLIFPYSTSGDERLSAFLKGSQQNWTFGRLTFGKTGQP